MPVLTSPNHLLKRSRLYSPSSKVKSVFCAHSGWHWSFRYLFRLLWQWRGANYLSSPLHLRYCPLLKLLMVFHLSLYRQHSKYQVTQAWIAPNLTDSIRQPNSCPPSKNYSSDVCFAPKAVLSCRSLAVRSFVPTLHLNSYSVASIGPWVGGFCLVLSSPLRSVALQLCLWYAKSGSFCFLARWSYLCFSFNLL